MTEWYCLLKYINYYVYNHEEEELMIKHDVAATEAAEAYEKALSVLEAKEKDTQDRLFRLLWRADPKWKFDIALDCVRRMSDEDRIYVGKHMYAFAYHFGYAMDIRNRYIHCSEKHNCIEPDNESGEIMEMIFSIINPIYDYKNDMIKSYYSCVGEYLDCFEDSYPQVFAEIEGNILNNKYSSSEDAFDELKNKLRECLGPDGFIQIFKDAVKEYEEKEDGKVNDRYWELFHRSIRAKLYPLYSKQVELLQGTNYFRLIKCGSLKTLSECREYIDENIGFKDEYADFMARCGWEAYSMYANE